MLFCSNNPFTELPAVLGQCPQLSMVGFKACTIRHVPAASLPRDLRWLILTDNQIGELPAEIVAAAVVSRDTIINPVDGTELIRIPAGEFIMGSDDGPENERPQQRLHLDEYYIARYPVTNDQ